MNYPNGEPGTALEALAKARAAWEATQPQTFLELWPDPDEREKCEPGLHYFYGEACECGQFNNEAELREWNREGYKHGLREPLRHLVGDQVARLSEPALGWRTDGVTRPRGGLNTGPEPRHDRRPTAPDDSWPHPFKPPEAGGSGPS